MGTTTNFAWEYPDNGGDEDTWGAIHTAMVEAIDAALATVRQQTAPTGAVMDFLRTSAPSGWIALSGTFGDASSGADYANDGAQDLFLLLWASFGNTIMPILNSNGTTGTRGATAADDWSAHKRLSFPVQPGLFRRSFGPGSGAIGVVQAQAFPAHTHSVDIVCGTGFASAGVAGSLQGTNSVSGSYSATSGSAGTGSDLRPANIAYLTCIKL